MSKEFCCVRRLGEQSMEAEVAEKLRKDLGYHQSLIIAATGYGQEKDRQQSRLAGIDHHSPRALQLFNVLIQIASSPRKRIARLRLKPLRS
jgi:hypothetical protein